MPNAQGACIAQAVHPAAALAIIGTPSYGDTMKRYCLLLLVMACAWAMPHKALAQRISLAIVTNPGSAQYVTAMAFQEALAATGSDMQVVIHHSASLGDETAIVQQLGLGAIQLAVVTAGPLDTFVPEAAVLSYPYLFDTYDHVDTVLEGPIGREVLDRFERQGLYGLAYAENGFRHLTNNVRPVKTVRDVAGLKIRVMRSSMHHALWRMFGANPTAMGWPIYTELAQGAVDGQENPLWVLWEAKLHEVQRYLSLTRHVYSAHLCLANLRWYGKLSPSDQQAVSQAMRQAARQQRTWAREREAAYLEKLRGAGMQIVEDVDVASFRQAAAGIQDAKVFVAPQVQELLRRVQAASKASAATQ